MDEASTYLVQIKTMSEFLTSTVSDVPAEVFNQRPGPHLNPIGWNYFHVLRLWDFDLNWIVKGQNRDKDAWHRGHYTEQSGYNPDGKGTLGLGVGYGYTDDEVDEIALNVDVLTHYQEMLLAETVVYLTNADNDEMRRQAPLVVNPDQTASVASRMQHVISHPWMHIGEMRYTKGMFGMHDASYREGMQRN
jgi:hypothetical protein